MGLWRKTRNVLRETNKRYHRWRGSSCYMTGAGRPDHLKQHVHTAWKKYPTSIEGFSFGGQQYIITEEYQRLQHLKSVRWEQPGENVICAWGAIREEFVGKTWIFIWRANIRKRHVKEWERSLMFLNGKVKTGMGKDAEIGVKITERNLLE